MKKKVIIISLSILMIIGLLAIIQRKNKKVYTNINGVKYAILVNGESSTSFPTGNYKADIECTNADAYWDSVAEKVIIKNIGDNNTCDLNFTSIEEDDYLNAYLTSLSGKIQGTGKLVEENGLRYEGKDPNNYIMFNNELWRIVGVFSDASSDSTNLVKIVRNESLGAFGYNSSGTIWRNSKLFALLNKLYYNWNSNSTLATQVCLGAVIINSNLRVPCDFTVSGIHDEYRSMIANAKWYFGILSSASLTAGTVYNKESNSSSVLAYVGLLSASDYLYAVLSTSCARSTLSSAYNKNACAGNNWLYGQGNIWFLNGTASASTNVYIMADNGIIAYYSGRAELVRPAVYLSPDVYRVSGTGSITDPYIIGLAENT